MLIYYFASLERYDHDDITNEVGQQRPLSSFKSFLAFIYRKDNRSLAICGLWGITCQVSNAFRHLLTDPGGDHLIGWFTLSSIFWFNAPILYLYSQLRNVLSQMSPSDISSYLSINILTIGISSITPMMYLSLDTIKCVSNADHTQSVYNQCSGVFIPQMSICIFLLIMTGVKVRRRLERSNSKSIILHLT